MVPAVCEGYIRVTGRRARVQEGGTVWHRGEGAIKMKQNRNLLKKENHLQKRIFGPEPKRHADKAIQPICQLVCGQDRGVRVRVLRMGTIVSG